MEDKIRTVIYIGGNVGRYKKLIICVVLLAYSLIIFVPPITYDYVYPNNSDDTGFHLEYFESLQDDIDMPINYLGQDIVGYPLVWLSDTSGISLAQLFLWFNIIALWAIGLIIFFVISQIVNWGVGLLSIPIVMFVTPSTMNLYDTGVIYDLITIGILVPLAIYCLIELIIKKKWYWGIPLILMSIMVIVVHTMVILPAIKFWNMTAEVQTVSLMEFVGYFSGYGIVLLFALSMFMLVIQKKNDNHLVYRKQLKIALIIIGASVLLLLILAFTGIIGWSLRIALDASVLCAILAACVLGFVLKPTSSKLSWVVASVVVVLLSIPILQVYLGYNSAIKDIDKQAIAYVNTLGGDYYSCSPEVAPWVYGNYLNKEYKENALPHIVRNMPMTSRTNPKTEFFWWKSGAMGYPHDNDIYVAPSGDNIMIFSGGDVEINVIY